ncbi:MAG TPA: membrane protein insertion efficiency factor YidD [Myxococcales bacterium]
MTLVARAVRRALQLLLLALVGAYRKLVSPLLPPACRFYPSCSQYAQQALSKHGPFKGSVLAAKRLLRCHPLHEGGIDPVP